MTKRLPTFGLLGLATVLAACSPYLERYATVLPEVETGFYSDIDTPRLALLEYRLAEYFARDERPYEVVCAASTRLTVHEPWSRSEALDPETERTLIARFPTLSPLSRCEREGPRDIVASDTRQPAAIFDVHDFSCETPDNCLGWAGYYANGQHGWSYYRMRFERGEWRIRREELDIQLTGS